MAVLEGFERLDAKLLAMGSPKQIKGIARNAIRVGQRVVVKGIKAQIPGRYKDARKTVGYSLKAGKGENAGTVVAKVGMGVGKKRGTREDAIAAKTARKALGKKGIGINARDAHWFVLGTRERTTGYKSVYKHGQVVGRRRLFVNVGKVIRRTGKMAGPIAGCVQAGLTASQGEAATKIKQNMAAGIAKLAK